MIVHILHYIAIWCRFTSACNTSVLFVCKLQIDNSRQMIDILMHITIEFVCTRRDDKRECDWQRRRKIDGFARVCIVILYISRNPNVVALAGTLEVTECSWYWQCLVHMDADDSDVCDAHTFRRWRAHRLRTAQAPNEQEREGNRDKWIRHFQKNWN